MSERVSWVPDGVDTGKPSAARLYDYLLGGGHNFAADRALAEKFLQAQPNARTIARLNRSFLRRAVLFMVDRGIRQFLDLGSGIPTVGNVHEIAQKADPESRVVYVDFEEVAVAHSQLILEHDPNATVIQEDMTKPDAVLQAARHSGLLDFARPIGVLTAGVFHFVPPQADPNAIVATYRDAVPAGSYLAVSQFTQDLQPEEMAGVVEVMKKSQNPMYPRTKSEIEALFDGFELVEPGIVPTPLWRPEGANTDDPDKAGIYAAVGRKV
ncbi:SAM-dependent methyltransferase [Lentzea flaviverrucosa]|uniref:S-adenosyl methyltransferase n=1 Tax=Lentzea flaviverrucosa TaxID=200379 RepID=A0A1H9XJU6_9PSEU|nr:SAM-dependent methyltransferase [Lentzea flaviverrucosa]RDI20285.1 S-adenosyl methyltransferase [Lentzea flaviverrucosa]SES46351.1 S-adenosyl methyltransferase [Lentzea flaviverrucosa]